jgi:hypothetical protein
VPPKSDPQSDHELLTACARRNTALFPELRGPFPSEEGFAKRLEAIAADRERRDMTSLRECALTGRLKEQPADDRNRTFPTRPGHYERPSDGAERGG